MYLRDQDENQDYLSQHFVKSVYTVQVHQMFARHIVQDVNQMLL
jgi:hypothetical protein